MNALISKTIGTRYGEKDISVYAQDIVDIREPIDVMTVSAFLHGYNPSPDTLRCPKGNTAPPPKC